MHKDGLSVGGDEEWEQLRHLFSGDERPGVDGLVVVGQRLVLYPAGYRPRPQRGDLFVNRLYLGAESRVIDGQGRRLNDDDLGQLLRPP